ncbi:MAG TPA: helix-hairpin-helix domain-containing protein, partial [Streptosporangiaceae bacterium]
MSDESATRLFGEFCGAGLWPGVGRAMAEKLQAAGITSPDDVTAGRLELVEGIGPKRAIRLAAAFTRAQPAYETAGLLTSCRVPAKYAGSAVALLGPLAAETLREDPWKLLTLPQIRPDQADWFARQVLDDGATPQDPRRGRALVVHLLNKASRDGHTAAPAEAVLAALGRFGVGDPGSAVVAAIDDGSVLPFEAHQPGDAEEAEDPVEADGEDSGEVIELGTLLALTQYAIAEDAVAEGLQRLAATAEPLPGTGDPLAAVTDAELDDRQHAAVAAVAEHGV